jgi:lysophospholipase L1-like esterase
MWRYVPEMMALPIYPWLSWQGKTTRKNTLRLPEASGARHGIVHPYMQAQTPPLRFLGIGESPVAGVGVETYQQAITAEFARQLATYRGLSVEWTAMGKNGATVRTALQALADRRDCEQVDMALIAFGVNDTTSFRSVQTYQQDLSDLLQVVREKFCPQQIIVSGIPPMQFFPALPQPLRAVLGRKASTLDRATRELIANCHDILHVPMQLDVKRAELMAIDGYHPSILGVQMWASHLLEAYRLHVV